MFTSFRYPTPKQGLIWLKRRQQVRPSIIAEELQVSRPFVSKAQQRAEARIEKLLQHAASINRIEVKHLSPCYGIAVGYCSAYQAKTYITYSPKIGIQTWFAHQGDCGSCAQESECKRIIAQLAQEWQISIPTNQSPTDTAKHLFTTIQKRLKWENDQNP
ncbi:MAG: hypothetical protein ACFFCH_02915 [Promethearchaeota archaeon]